MWFFFFIIARGLPESEVKVRIERRKVGILRKKFFLAFLRISIVISVFWRKLFDVFVWNLRLKWKFWEKRHNSEIRVWFFCLFFLFIFFLVTLMLFCVKTKSLNVLFQNLQKCIFESICLLSAGLLHPDPTGIHFIGTDSAQFPIVGTKLVLFTNFLLLEAATTQSRENTALFLLTLLNAGKTDGLTVQKAFSWSIFAPTHRSVWPRTALSVTGIGHPGNTCSYSLIFVATYLKIFLILSQELELQCFSCFYFKLYKGNFFTLKTLCIRGLMKQIYFSNTEILLKGTYINIMAKTTVLAHRLSLLLLEQLHVLKRV